MANTAYRSVSEYIAAQPRAVQPILRKVRAAIRKAVPKAEEMITYQIPTYKLDGERVVYFAGWAKHYSIYPAIGQVAVALREELEPYKVTKGTIRFPLDQPVPVGLIGRIAKIRAKEATARVNARPGGKKR